MVQMKDRWSYDNQDSEWPSGLSSTWNSYGNSSDFWQESRSFLRIQDITLGYSLPSKVIQKQNLISGLRVTLSAQNVFVFTNYSGIDPELDSWVAYPNPRSFIIGLNVSF